jgi:hypothetical protein
MQTSRTTGLKADTIKTDVKSIVHFEQRNMPIHDWTRVDAGIFHHFHLDLFPPGPRDPQGMHKPIWGEFVDNEFALPSVNPLTLASFIGGPVAEAFVEPMFVGAVLPEMPLFLTPEVYVPLPLEATYQSAWEAVPSYWRDFITSPVPL